MSDIDQVTYGELHARVNDGTDGAYGTTHPLERLDSSRNQVVLAWGKDEPLLIHTDLKTCQMCGTNMRNPGGKEECVAKRCDTCGWSIVKDGFPALVKLDHAYPTGRADGDIDPRTGEAVPGYMAEIGRLNEEAHKARTVTPDAAISVNDAKNKFRLAADSLTDEERKVVEGMNGQAASGTIYAIGSLLALAVFAYRVMTIPDMSGVQAVCELLLACCASWIYVVIVVLLMATQKQKSQD